MMKELGMHQKIISILIRVGPIPPGLQNAILAVSPVTVDTYLWTSFFGSLLKQVPLTFVGAGCKNFNFLICRSFLKENILIFLFFLFLI
jgi:uncharacterized membrane protein YdjX (TVP38/TMEM64 family)